MLANHDDSWNNFRFHKTPIFRVNGVRFAVNGSVKNGQLTGAKTPRRLNWTVPMIEKSWSYFTRIALVRQEDGSSLELLGSKLQVLSNERGLKRPSTLITTSRNSI